MIVKDQQGQLVLGCLIMILYLLGPIVFIVGGGIAFYRNSKLQAQLNNPEVHYLHQKIIEERDYEFNAAIPSKVMPGSNTWARVWITPKDVVTSTQIFSVSTYVEPPMFVIGSSTITITSNTDDSLNYDSLGKFDYEVIGLETEQNKLDLELEIDADFLSSSETMTLEIPLDSEVARRRIIVNRRWQILTMVIGALVPIVLGFLFE